MDNSKVRYAYSSYYSRLLHLLKNKLAGIDKDSRLHFFLESLLSRRNHIVVGYNFLNYDKNHKYCKFIFE